MRTFTSRSAAGAAALSFALLVTGCSSSGDTGDSSQAGPVSLEFWGWAPGYDKITAQWNAAHPDVKVTFKQIPSGAKGGYDQMTNAITAGKAPCLAQVTYNDIPSMLVKKALMDITPYASGDTGKYLDWTVAASSAERQDVRHPRRHRADGPVLPHRPVQEVRHRQAPRDLGRVRRRRRQGPRGRPEGRLRHRAPGRLRHGRVDLADR